MALGVFFILAACFCWGFIFVVPQFLPAFDPIEVALGRFFIFGIASVLFVLIKQRYLFQQSYIRFWRKAFGYGMLSAFIPYTGLVCCLRYANPAVTALIYGLSPIAISLLGGWKKKQLVLRNFLMPGILTLCGLTCINLEAFHYTGASVEKYLFGLLCGFIGLGSWTWYTVINSELIEKHPDFPLSDWLSMIGTAICLLMFIIAGVGLSIVDWEQVAFKMNFFPQFLLGSTILGIISSYAAFFFWNHGTKRLPISLVGQLSIFEMLFGLLFIFTVESRLPTLLEVTGSIFIIGAVFLALRSVKFMPVP